MSSYSIIDEPKQNRLNGLILNPIIILFASILVPIFVSLPYFGRIWIPAAWLILNSLLLKSATRWREIIVSLLAVIGWFTIIYGSVVLLYFFGPDEIKKAAPYIRIFSQATFYFCLIYVVALQSTSYSLYEYITRRQ
jgi:hypothetical protein